MMLLSLGLHEIYLEQEKKYFKKKTSHSKVEASKTPDSQQKTNKQKS